MKLKTKENEQRLYLIFLFAAAILMVLIVTTVIASVIVIYLIHRGSLVLDTSKVSAGSLLLSFILWNLAIGAVIAIGASGLSLKPINKILNAMNSLASGDYSVRLAFKGIISRNRTVVELTDSFNTMASELEKTEMLSSDFINNFSHEFKTPIVSIAGFAKLLKRGNLSDEQKTEYLNIIEKESLRLSQMATNVLDLTNVENQSILTDVHNFNLSEQLRMCILMLEDKWAKKNLEFSLPSEETFVTGNEDLLRQVWINLFDNAIKFSDEGGTVEVTAERSGGHVNVRISDTGEEIPEKSMEKIFKKFYQADESHTTEGNGVGLAVVKKIIDLHGGDVSAACGGGKTVFTVTIPER